MALSLQVKQLEASAAKDTTTAGAPSSPASPDLNAAIQDLAGQLQALTTRVDSVVAGAAIKAGAESGRLGAGRGASSSVRLGGGAEEERVAQLEQGARTLQVKGGGL